MTEENTLKNDVLKVYEVGYLLLSNIEDTKTQEESLKIRDIIEKNKGQFLSEGTPKMTNLTYPMVKSILGKKQKFDNAYFGWIKFEGTSDFVKEIKISLDKFDNILRYILITTVKENVIVPAKSGKFSFNKKTEEVVEDKSKDNDKDSKDNSKDDSKVKKGEKEIDKKVLDSTIDELVIE